MRLELQDIMFFIKAVKLDPSASPFNFVQFSHSSTRSGANRKLIQPLVKNNITLIAFHNYGTLSLFLTYPSV